MVCSRTLFKWSVQITIRKWLLPVLTKLYQIIAKSDENQQINQNVQAKQKKKKNKYLHICIFVS